MGTLKKFFEQFPAFGLRDTPFVDFSSGFHKNQLTMLFAEPLFLFLFLPVFLMAYFICGSRFRNALLVCASLLFYTSGEAWFALVLIYSIAFNYLMGLWIERAKSHTAVTIGITGNLAPLVVLKYAGFVEMNLNAALAAAGGPTLPPLNIHLPIGVSFFTFQAMSYIIDIYRGELKAQPRPGMVATYLSMFPHLVAGPIVRYRDIMDQLAKRTVTMEDFAEGARRVAVGLGKKKIVADSLAVCSDGIFAIPGSQLTTGLAWLGAACYTLQIYYDFSGYSDMAIGLARMMGIRFRENFNYPYSARTVGEFWRRWHISLSSWFRDYLYIPLGGNRRGAARTYFNLILVFALCGLWHGAKWGFIVWGLYHGSFMIAERLGVAKALERHKLVGHFYTTLAVTVGWVFFRAATLPQAWMFLRAMAGFPLGDGVQYHASLYLDNLIVLLLVAGAVGSYPLFQWLAGTATRLLRGLTGWKFRIAEWTLATWNVAALCALLLASLTLIASGTFKPFLYSRF